MKRSGSGDAGSWVMGAAFGGALALVAVLFVVWQTGGPTEAPRLAGGIAPPEAIETVASPPEADPEVATAFEAEPAPAQPTAETVVRPRLDEVRLEPDGLAVIAGRATPNSALILRADGEEIARTSADGAGKFATVAMLSPSAAARVLTLAELDLTGGEIHSADELILAPVALAAAPPVPSVPAKPPLAQALPPTGPANRAEPPASAPDLALVAEGPPPAVTTSKDAHSATAPAAVSQDPDAPEATGLAAAPTHAVPAAPDAGATPAVPDPGAPARIAVLRNAEDGVSVIQPPGPSPEAIKQIALDTISYSLEGDVQLSGRAQADAEAVRVYLDNEVIATLSVDKAGTWRGTLPDVDARVYTLRLDEVNAAGAVTSRVETPFKREAPGRLAAATELAGDGTAPAVQAVTVQSGDTLWAISRSRYGDGFLYVRVFEANRESIRDPDLIYPGQVFTLPAD